jgi:hypothetical protein
VKITQDTEGKVFVDACARNVKNDSFATICEDKVLFRVHREGFMHKKQARILASTLESDLTEWLKESGAKLIGAVEYSELWSRIGE